MDRVDELNNRIKERHFGTDFLEPVFDPRPINTRGGMMPVVDTEVEPSVEYFNYKMYNPEQMFTAATKKPPYKGFSNRINDESELRNQFFALQRSEKGTYLPSSNSDLYTVDLPYTPLTTDQEKHQHKLLFKTDTFSAFNPSSSFNKDKGFHNDTIQDRLNSSN